MKQLFTLLQYLLPSHFLSRLTGKLADCRWPWLKNLLIGNFIRAYGVDMSEAIKTDIAAFDCFNDFFTRELKPGIRPQCREPGVLVSPVDGAVSEAGRIDADKILQAKGKHYTLLNLLGGSERLAATFVDGAFITLYLSPKDYHRVHAPLQGQLIESFYLPGSLFSVNEISVNSITNLFARNERLVTIFDTAYGKMALIMVGAMIVAGIKTVWNDAAYPPNMRGRDDLTNPLTFDQGDELGEFRLGSTVILLFEAGDVAFAEGMTNQRAVKLGEKLGEKPGEKLASKTSLD